MRLKHLEKFIAAVVVVAGIGSFVYLGQSPESAVHRENVPTPNSKAPEGAVEPLVANRSVGPASDVASQSHLATMKISQEAEAAAHRLAAQRSGHSQVERDVFTSPQKFLERAKKGESKYATALFLALAHKAPGISGLPGYSAEDWNKWRIESLEWLSAAAMKGDYLAMLYYGTQAQAMLELQPELPPALREKINLTARGYLFSLVGNRVLEAYPWAAGYYHGGELGRVDLAMSAMLLDRYVAYGGDSRLVADQSARLEARLTAHDRQQMRKLSEELDKNPKSALFGSRI